jgi:N-acetylated-alpha-linked acidic dipeptidase
VLVFGHIDTWYDGATDNATGNAFMLEMARILATHKDRIKRSVKLAWWPCHSTGMYSASTWYAENFWEDVRDNMIAYFTSDSPGTKGGVIYASSVFPELRNFHVNVVKEIIGKDPVVERFKRKTGDNSFVNAGVPLITDSLMLAPDVMSKLPYGATPWWHTDKDTIDKVDLEGPGRIQFGTYMTSILRICNSDVLPFEFVSVGEEMIKNLKDLSSKVGTELNLDRLVAKAQEFKTKAEKLRHISSKKGLSNDGIQRINKAMIKLSRTLNPVLYTAKSKYAQDSYHTLMLKDIGMFPRLHPAMELTKLPKDSDPCRSLRKKMTRERNRAQDAIDQSIDIIDALLEHF